MKLIFVGEKRSERAKQLNVRWEDGALAAKPLFVALRAAGVDPLSCLFVNWLEPGGPAAVMEQAWREDVRVFAMGRKVQKAMTQYGVPYVPLIHPAARGKIRKRELYMAHVFLQLSF